MKIPEILIVETIHQPGSLAKVLMVIAEAGTLMYMTSGIKMETVLGDPSKQSGFLGKVSPVHFFWGSFDLAVTRFSGRPAPLRPGADKIQREAYSHEVISAGFWPGNGGYGAAAFYCYAAPVPEGLAVTRV